MTERYADKQIKLFSLTSNLPIAEKLLKLLESLLEKCLHVNFPMEKL